MKSMTMIRVVHLFALIAALSIGLAFAQTNAIPDESPPPDLASIESDAAAAPGASDFDATQGLVAYYPFNGNANDESGNGRNGRVMGTTATAADRFGMPSAAYRFDGVSSGITVTNTVLNIGQAEYTVSAWFCSDDLSKQRQVVFNTIPHTGIGLGINHDAAPGYFFSYIGPANAYWTVTASHGPKRDYTNQVWYHMAFTKSGTTYRTYINGTLELEQSVPQAASYNCNVGCFFGTIGTIFREYDDGFKGRLDDFRIYSRTLSSNEVALLYAQETVMPDTAPIITAQPQSLTVDVGETALFSVTAAGSAPLAYQWRKDAMAITGATNSSHSIAGVMAGDAGSYDVVIANAFGNVTSAPASLTVTVPQGTPPPSGLVAWWQGNGNPLDSVGTNHGILMNGATFGVGKVGQGFVFDGVNDYVQMTTTGLPTGNQDRTIEYWVKVNSFVADEAFMVGYGTLGDYNHYYGITMLGNRLTFSQWGGTLIGPALATNKWHHVAVSSVGNRVSIYLNGSNVANGTLAFSTPPGSKLHIGSVPSPYGSIRRLNGRLDEVSVYNRALTTNEIAAIYVAGAAGKNPLPPTIVSVTPSSWYVNEGANVAFTAAAVGSPVLAYQWQHNGGDLPGATSPTLTLDHVVYAQAGTYTAVVSGPGGTAGSNVLLRINRAPLAAIGNTERLLISPNGINAVAVLDGTQSSDPDGDALTYAWYRAGETNAFATGAVAVETLPLGMHHLRLVVRDGMASGPLDFTVEVITTTESVDRLISLVQSGSGQVQPLYTSLRAALAAIDRSQPATAINQLEAFKNKVLAQVMPVDAALAGQLLADAQAIIDALNGGATSAMAPMEITSLNPQGQGRAHLKIRGSNNRVVIIEASSNLVDWEKVGIARASGDRAYEFEDLKTPVNGARFYRIVSPK